MYENYLISPPAIAAVMTSTIADGGDDVTPEKVEQWLKQHQWDKKYFDGRAVPESARTEDLWLETVDGAHLLRDLFEELSENAVTYKKVNHGREITRWLCENTPENLQSLSDFLVETLERGGTS
jgi:hypothetical protein